MELKETVDILEMLVRQEEREATPEELRRAGEMLISLVDSTLRKDKSLDPGARKELKDELRRALACLEERPWNPPGESGVAAGEIAERIRGFLGELASGDEAPASPGISPWAEKEREATGQKEDGTIASAVGTRPGVTGGEEGSPSIPWDAVELGRRVREKRLKFKLRQKDLAGWLGISTAYLSLLENGRCSLPSPAIRVKILSFLEGRDSPMPVPGRGAEGVPRGPRGTATWQGIECSRRGRSRPQLVRRLLRTALVLGEEDLEVLARIAEALWEERGQEPIE